MPEYTNAAVQTVAANQNVLFTSTPVGCNTGNVIHREGSGIGQGFRLDHQENLDHQDSFWHQDLDYQDGIGRPKMIGSLMLKSPGTNAIFISDLS